MFLKLNQISSIKLYLKKNEQTEYLSVFFFPGFNLFQVLLYFVCLVTYECSIPAMHIWSILLIQSDFIMMYLSNEKSLFVFQQLVIVTAGGT